MLQNHMVANNGGESQFGLEGRNDKATGEEKDGGDFLHEIKGAEQQPGGLLKENPDR